MRRWLTNLGIGGYLSALLLGIACHTFGVGLNLHPAMYFVVWDMFCGWAGYEGRMEVVGEGASGKFYQLAPGPWGDFHPYGQIGRQHYDTYCTNGFRIANNCLAHTAHEPMARIFVVEVEYPKRFNIPQEQYEAYYSKPKEYHRYCHTRFVLTPEGEILRTQPNWLTFQYQVGVRDNPRLVVDSQRNRPFLTIGAADSGTGTEAVGSYSEVPSGALIAGPLAQ